MTNTAIHILLIETEAARAELLTRSLRASDSRYHLSTAGTLEQARAGLSENEPDLIIADLLLADGRCTELIADDPLNPRWPMIVMVSRSDENLAVEAIKAGALDYLIKNERTPDEIARVAGHALREWSHICKCRQAENALREGEGRLHTVVEACQDAMIAINNHGRITIFNRAAETMFGRSNQEMLGGTLDCLLPEEYRDRHHHYLMGYFTEGKPDGAVGRTVELPALRKNGSRFPIELSLSAGWHGGQKFVVAVVRDITQRRNTDNDLRESEERFRTLSTATLEGVLVHDKGVILFANQAVADMFGYTFEELIGTDALLLAVEKDREEVGRNIRLGYEDPYEVTGMRRDGSLLTVEIRGKGLQYRDREVRVTVIRDVTRQRQAAEELLASEKRYQELFNSVLEGIGLINTDGIVEFCNPAYARIFDFDSAADIIDTSILDCLTKSQRETIFDSSRQNGYQAGNQHEMNIVTPRNNQKTILVTVSPRYGAGGRFIGALVAITDITERKRIEKRQRQLQEKLQRAQRMESIGVLAGGVAHDLNNMLGPLVGYPELILRKLPEDSPVCNQVRKIGRAACEAADVIRDLLTLARRGRYEMVPLRLNEVIEGYFDSPSYTVLSEKHPQTRVTVNLDQTIDAITGSAAHLSKVIMNLIVNAFDAMPDGGELTVETCQKYIEQLDSGYHKLDPGDYVLVRVRDTGMGIDPADIQKILEPYYSKKKMGSSGSGLGLSVVYGIVKDHQGFYDIFSELGKGAEFVLYFPVTRDAVEDEVKDETDLSGHESVLIIDDTAVQRDIAADLLGSLGYRTTAVGNGRDAVEFLKTNSVDMILLDMIMEPDFDGFDTYREIVKLHPGQKAVIVSGFSTTERVEMAQTLGAGAYVKKPYSLETIGKAVREELNRQPVALSNQPTT